MSQKDILAEARAKLDRASPAEIARYMDTPFIKQVASSLESFDREERKVVLDEIIQAIASGDHPADRLELLARLADLRIRKHPELADKPVEALSLEQALESCDLTALVEAVESRSKDLVLPEPSTGQNVETLMMSYGYWLTPIAEKFTSEEMDIALKAALARSPLPIERIRKRMEVFTGVPEEQALRLLTFGSAWFRSAFARLEVGHKLAASLCLTDVPEDIEVKAPWEAWSLVIPDGLLGVDESRAWCLGTEPVFLVMRDGFVWDLNKPGVRHPSSSWGKALGALVRGACLALSNPDDFRKERRHGPTARAASKHRKGPPDLAQARYMLSAPVKVDLREHLTRVLSSRKGASPTVQFLVRGHWRSQAHGPKHALRKTIWVEPFWKGPEESRILLRQHQVEEPQKTPD